jgi:hypothetical protein
MPRIPRRIGAETISNRTLTVNLLRLLRKQQQQITQLKNAVGSIGLTLVEREPSLIPELRAHLDAFIQLEKEELPADVEAREIWSAFLTQQENEIISDRKTIVQ